MHCTDLQFEKYHWEDLDSPREMQKRWQTEQVTVHMNLWRKDTHIIKKSWQFVGF